MKTHSYWTWLNEDGSLEALCVEMGRNIMIFPDTARRGVTDAELFDLLEKCAWGGKYRGGR